LVAERLLFREHPLERPSHRPRVLALVQEFGQVCKAVADIFLRLPRLIATLLAGLRVLGSLPLGLAGVLQVLPGLDGFLARLIERASALAYPPREVFICEGVRETPPRRVTERRAAGGAARGAPRL